MTTPFVASASRPLRLRKRPDLRAVVQSFQGRRCYLLKDPLSLRYFRFEEQEFALLEMLDGQTSLEELRAAYGERFAPERITLGELQRLVGMLHQSGLVLSDAPGQGEQLAARSRSQEARARKAVAANLLSLRLRGFDPTRLLQYLDRAFGWLFSRTGVACGLAMAAAALLLVFAQFEAFRLRLPGFEEFFAAENWFWLALTLAGTKIAHEIGHGLACRRQGGECHEMGLMLLVFTPCLYCNVSDSWMLPNKHRRAAIAAAGMYVELLLAAAATWVWWFTHPGLVHYLSLNVMFVCSVSTLVFNANPLLKYDGYYILSDLTEIPNLRARADEQLLSLIRAAVFGGPRAWRPFAPRRGGALLAAYAVMAAAYRVLVTIGVLWFLYHVLAPYGLKIVGQMLALGLATAMAARMAIWVGKFRGPPGRSLGMNRWRAIVWGGVLLCIAAGILLAPLPHDVPCRVVLALREAAPVYVEVPGELVESYVGPGQQVRKGAPLARLANYDLELEIEKLQGERQRLATRLEALERRAFRDRQAATAIAHTTESLRSIEHQLQKRDQEQQRLVVRAPQDGEVIWPPAKATTAADRFRLASWTGAPLEACNRGAWLSEGSLLCKIGETSRLSANLFVDQSDIEFVAPGQPAALVMASAPGKRIWTKIDRVARVEQTAPGEEGADSASSASGGPQRSSQPPPQLTVFQASAPVDDPAGVLVLGGTGHAKIRVGSRTVGQRLWRTLCAVFEFEL